MLNRVADSIYWMSRYVERAENVARFFDANFQLVLDGPPYVENQWQPLISATGDPAEFARRYGPATAQNALEFLTFDLQNPNSILSCLQSARENARRVREVISSEMWLQLNRFYLMVKEGASGPKNLDLAADFLQEVKYSSHRFSGVSDATMTHNTSWHFLQLGRMLERADNVSRLLDIKYYALLRTSEGGDHSLDHIQWAAVLRSASAFEMYCKRQGQISPAGVVEFLLLDREFPRSIQFSLRSARESLHQITGTPVGAFRDASEKLLGQICADLVFVTVEDIIQKGLHEYIDGFQTKLNQAAQSISEKFFVPANSPSVMSSPV